ncbi:MAG: CCA tRNA nucleotidyltransferase [Thermoprotei archaeon]|nr:MAG: CCA tRNA nucleotidyltransferase [Thermoprotei archaeon]
MNKKFETIEQKVLEKIKPKPEEYREVEKVFNRIKEVIESILEKNKIEAEITLQGSIAHDTWLSGDHDLDIFVLFPKNWEIEELKTRGFNLLLKAAKIIGDYETKYAEHPYVRVRVNDFQVDLVPAYKLEKSSEIKTAVDRTPFHTKYLNNKLNSYLRDQVRLLKQFMKSIGVYGAEQKTRGFSGYAVELLIIKYGSFRKLLLEAEKWKHPVFINTLESDALFKKIRNKLLRKYPESVIYMPDPVDPLRNVTAAVSLKSLATFVIASRCYLNNPSENYFFPIQENNEEKITIALDNRCILLLEIPIDEKLSPEILWGELQRIGDRGAKVLRNNDFRVIHFSVYTDEEKHAYIAYELDQCTKNYPREYVGPEYWTGKRTLNFIKTHLLRQSSGPWINEEGKLVSLSQRKYIDAIKLLIDRAWEYLVTPHFKSKKPIVKRITHEEINNLRSIRGLYEWIKGFILKRPHWMEYCIE